MNAIELENVTKTFGNHTAVDALSLRVPVGSVYGFIGPNGSGKTTTLRMIMHIIHADQGRIRQRPRRLPPGRAWPIPPDESRRAP